MDLDKILAELQGKSEPIDERDLAYYRDFGSPLYNPPIDKVEEARLQRIQQLEDERVKEKEWKQEPGAKVTKKRGPSNKIKGKEQADEIRARYARGGVTYKDLADEYGVVVNTIGNIVRNKSWKS